MDAKQPNVYPWEVRDLIIDEHCSKLLKLSETEWWEYQRKITAAHRILDSAANSAETLREIRAELQKETERQTKLVYRDEFLLSLPLVGQSAVYFVDNKWWPVGLMAIISVIVIRQQLFAKIGNLKATVALHSNHLESLKKDFREHFGNEVSASKLDEIIGSWASDRFEHIKHLESKALDRIQVCSQARYREHLEKVVKPHEF